MGPRVTEEDPQQGLGCAAVAVVLIVVAVPLALLRLASRDLFIAVVVLTAWGAVLWAARTRSPVVLDDRNYVRGETNPAPPAPSERGSNEEPQVSMMRDQSHPNRWVVTRPLRWLTESHDRDD